MEGVEEVATGRPIEEAVWKNGRIWRERQKAGERSADVRSNIVEEATTRQYGQAFLSRFQDSKTKFI